MSRGWLRTRTESDVDHQFLSHASVRENPLPLETENAKDLRIVSMIKNRQIRVRWISGPRKDAADFTTQDTSVKYSEKSVKVSRFKS